MTDIVYAWHFLPSDGRLTHGDGREAVTGETLSVDVQPVIRHRGLHASERVIDAIRYGAGPLICRVAVWGDVEHESDVLVGRHRHVIWQYDATDALWSYACDCAEWALEQELAAGRDVDERSYAAIAARRDWLAGYDVDLGAARVAASHAASSTALCGALRSTALSARAGANLTVRRRADEAAWCSAWYAADGVATETRESTSDIDDHATALGVLDYMLEDSLVCRAKEVGVWTEDYDPRAE